MPNACLPVSTKHRTWLPAGVAVAFACLYAATAARTVQGFDCGELTAMAHNWGVAHPPGFATFALLAGVFAHASPLPAAHTLALLSALAGALTCCLLTACLLRLRVRPGAALAMTCAWGLLAPTWRLHTEQEVFALAHLAVALLTWLSIRQVQDDLPRSPFWLGLASAAGAGVHTTVVLVAPVVAWALWAGNGPKPSRRVALFGLGAALGLLPLLYLPLASLHGGVPSWGQLSSLTAVVRHILRSDYGILSLALGNPGTHGAVVGRYAAHLLIDGALLLPVALAIGLTQTWRHTSAQPGLLRAISLAFSIAALLFLGAFATPDTAWWHEIAQRFFPATDLYAALLAGVGLEHLWSQVPRRAARSFPAAVGLWLVLVAAIAVPSGPSTGRDALHAYADGVLSDLPRGAILIGQGDDDASAFWEAQSARGQRPDVGFVLQALLPWPWYATTTALVASGYRQPEHLAGIRLLIEHSLRLGRPVYLTGALPPGLRTRYATVPAGLAVRVLPSTSTLPEPAKLEADLMRFFRAHPPPRLADWRRRNATERGLAQRNAAPWLALAGGYRSLGDADAASRCEARARDLLSQ